jgi:hypothetical protein
MYLAKLKKSGHPTGVSSLAADCFPACPGANLPDLRPRRTGAAASVNRWIKFSSGVAEPAAGCRLPGKNAAHRTRAPDFRKFVLQKILSTARRSDRAPS